jgi:hypothetical protein
MTLVRRHCLFVVAAAAFLAAVFSISGSCAAADVVASGLPTGDLDWVPADIIDEAFAPRQSTSDSMLQLASTSMDTAPILSGDGDVSASASAPFGLEYTPWRERRGPAYPDRKWHSVGRDLKELPETLWDDTKHTFTDPIVLGGFGVAAVAGVVLNLHVDSTVSNRTAHGQPHLNRWEDHLGNDWIGTPALHFPAAAGMYTVGLLTEDTKLYETSKAMFNALTINGVSNLILKVAVNNHSPDHSHYAWPSGHTSSSFTFATVLAESYGPCVGVPAFALATFVGYERIDSRRHQFSDVISGMIMGIVIGHSVTQNHMTRIMGMDVEPMISPETQAAGISLVKRW